MQAQTLTQTQISQCDWYNAAAYRAGHCLPGRAHCVCTARLPGLHAHSLPLFCLLLVEGQHDVCGMQMLV